MKTDIVLKLLEAGYTKADIDLMEDMKPAEPERPAEPAEPEQPAEPAEPEQPAEPEENTNEQLTQLLEVVGKLQKTVDAMQKTNAEKAESPKPEKLNTRQVLTDFFGEKKKE